MVVWKDYSHIARQWRVTDKYGTYFDGDKMWDDLYDQCGAQPNGDGNLVFDTDDGKTLFLLKYPQNDYAD